MEATRASGTDGVQLVHTGAVPAVRGSLGFYLAFDVAPPRRLARALSKAANGLLERSLFVVVKLFGIVRLVGVVRGLFGRRRIVWRRRILRELVKHDANYA